MSLNTTQGNPGPATYSECFKCGGTRFSNGALRDGVRNFRCSQCGQYRADNGNSPGRRSKPSERARAVRMYQMGITSTVISKEIGRSVQSILTWVREAGVPVFLDVDTPKPDSGALLDRVDFPIVPRGFAESLDEDRSLRGALTHLGAHGGRAAVVTLGAAGALARCGEEFIESPAYRVEAIDTTGAGDVFRGAFVWAVLQGWDVATVLDAANAAAAMSCRVLGAQGGLPSQGELEAFRKDNEPGPWRGVDFAGV